MDQSSWFMWRYWGVDNTNAPDQGGETRTPVVGKIINNTSSATVIFLDSYAAMCAYFDNIQLQGWF